MQRHTPISEAGLPLLGHPEIPVIADGDFVVLPDNSLGGDTPKAQIMWQHDRWLCKTPLHRHPLEAVYEHLLTGLAGRLGIEVADTRLVHIGGQIRLLSRWFLGEGETFESGQQCFGDNPDIEGVAAQLGTAPDLRDAFLKMCFFDALTGHTDRNPGNWGFILKDEEGACRPPDGEAAPRAARLAERSAHLPATRGWSPAAPARYARSRTREAPSSSVRFAPVFDTVRALMLNIGDDRLTTVRQHPKVARLFWESQLHSVLPKLHLRAGREVSHLADVSALLASGLPYPEDWLRGLVSEATEHAAMQWLDETCGSMLTEVRLWAIGEVLRRRWRTLRRHVEAARAR